MKKLAIWLDDEHKVPVVGSLTEKELLVAWASSRNSMASVAAADEMMRRIDSGVVSLIKKEKR